VRRDLAHRDAGEAPLGEPTLGRVENRITRGGGLAEGGGGARTHRPTRTRTNVRLSTRNRGDAVNSRLPVIDADGHVTEPPTLWAGYVGPASRERAPRPALDERGRPCMLLDGRLVMRHAMLLTFGPDYDIAGARIAAGGWDPHARLRDMDADGIDVAVLFP